MRLRPNAFSFLSRITIQHIKVGRLMFAIAVTVLIADTAPHPGLSAGLLETSWGNLANSFVMDSSFQAASSDITQ